MMITAIRGLFQLGNRAHFVFWGLLFFLIGWVVVPVQSTAQESDPVSEVENEGEDAEGEDAEGEGAEGEGAEEEVEPAPEPPRALELSDLPPVDLSEFLNPNNGESWAIVLGKALFWDQQLGSDGRVACATCHFHAGIDVRTRNTVAPGGTASAQSGGEFQRFFRGANVDLTSSDFPFHKKIHPLKRPSSINESIENTLDDKNDVVGSQGVIRQELVKIKKRRPVEKGKLVWDEIYETFNIGGTHVRSSTGRNSPTVINAALNDRNFWDGRAERSFNGVNSFGKTDPTAMVWKKDHIGRHTRKHRINIENASLASQAVGPPLNIIETSFSGRTFPMLGKKMLSLRPLQLQDVHPDDSVLGQFSYARKRPDGKGLIIPKYSWLIRKAFKPDWWAGRPLKINKKRHTHMEANFSLFWGIAIMSYQRTLISNQSKFDEFARGNATLTASEERGLDIFLNNGKCINCHSGPEFTKAVTRQQHLGGGEPDESVIELMRMQFGNIDKFYDSGFYNIGVRPTIEDLGLGSVGFNDIPLSRTRRSQDGLDDEDPDVDVPPGAPVAVDGSFKVPTLRNVELTGPYMHTGTMKSLEEVVEFYARGGDFKNEHNRAPDVNGIKDIRITSDSPEGDRGALDDLVAFMKTLTDERVRHQKAPFDHPSLTIPNGHSSPGDDNVALDNLIVVPAVGADGSARIRDFEEILNDGGLHEGNITGAP